MDRSPAGVSAASPPTDDASTPAVFHAQCDAFDETVSVATNSLGYTFGGFSDEPWTGSEWHCTGMENSFIFGLAPGTPTKFSPSGSGDTCQFVDPGYWPGWGRNSGGYYDLTFANAPQSLTNAGSGYCNQAAFTAATDEICGGYQNWGTTQLEVWRRVQPIDTCLARGDNCAEQAPDLSWLAASTCVDGSCACTPGAGQDMAAQDLAAKQIVVH